VDGLGGGRAFFLKATAGLAFTSSKLCAARDLFVSAVAAATPPGNLSASDINKIKHLKPTQPPAAQFNSSAVE
jgi:hypothetical protein